MTKQHLILRNLLSSIILLFIIIGIIHDGFSQAITQFVSIQLSPARLISDFISIAGIGGALINSALVGLVGLVIILKLDVKLSGPTFAAVFTLMGFGLFGKTVLNIIPIILGVYLSGKFVGKEFKEYIIIALFGTALGPIVSLIAFEIGLTGVLGVITGISLGIITGFFLPSLAVAMLHLHQGYNLYNMGLTCGFLGLFAASFVKISGHKFVGQMAWYSEKSTLLTLLIPVLSLFLIILGIIIDKKDSIKSFFKIQKIPGRLPSDFMDIESLAGTLINSGVIGIVGTLYTIIIGGDFNGPVIGGLLTIIGFSAFGTNLKNSWPVVFGVILCALLFKLDLNSPGPILAAIFVTTLGPLAGEFGWKVGILAGFTHLVMVMETGGWHGAINLYNNGFAGGLTATIFVAVIQWYKTNKTEFKDTFRSKMK
ncbi:DUF1576 domain-containing protein [Thiospirochaeta perfilievii]|uniref:DUF1576 domain-containing protein n=1 Tax=Thiospirochaeta perfilievii TaxID=252967 RepID=A0A5C1QFK9_9SPIO|nr:DUF1576 domain-containing protein [Thiospirochaeta perfilievii]QEN04992.1 DUF1576 domain-containing protein [Thiospirochaeta perfilievii]